MKTDREHFRSSGMLSVWIFPSPGCNCFGLRLQSSNSTDVLLNLIYRLYFNYVLYKKNRAASGGMEQDVGLIMDVLCGLIGRRVALCRHLVYSKL